MPGPGRGILLTGRPLSGTAGRLLIVLPKGIGDVVYGLALVEAIKGAHPEIEITWVVQPAAAPLLKGHPSLAGVVTYAPSRGLVALKELFRELRAQRFDAVLNLGMYLHALPPVLLARARRIIGFDHGYAKDGLTFFHREKVRAPRGAHVMDVYFAACRYLGVEVSAPAWNLPLRGDEVASRNEFFAAAEARPRVALVPCAGRPEKDWPVGRYCELARRLTGAADAFVVVVGGPRAEEARAAMQIEKASPGTRGAVGDDLRRVLWILSGCDLVVAPDTGPIHMARALGKPVVGLYGHTDPLRYGPYPPFPGIVLDRYRFDGPDHLSSWQGSGGRTGRMDLIGVDEVEAACLALLQERGAARQHGLQGGRSH